MKNFFVKILAYIGGAIVYYLLAVLVLVVMEAFGDTIPNKFVSAVPVWVLGHVLLIAYAVIAKLLKKAKREKLKAEIEENS
jgi:ABC-type antimicrobial peptide transport system permease subunit